MNKLWTHAAPHKPRLLLLDHAVAPLMKLIEHFEAQDFEVIPMHLGTAAEGGPLDLQHVNVEEAVKYALRPGARIDMVLTNLRQPEYPHGLDVLQELKAKHFNGVTAAHEVEQDASLAAQVADAGGLGLFSTQAPAQTAQALREAWQSRGPSPV